MRSAVYAILVLAAVSLACVPARAESAPAGAVPFPVGKTTKLTAKNGPVYLIDGPLVIPKNVEITVQLDVRIIGINGASLDVQGGLKIHGTQDHWVVIKNVDFSPTRTPTRGLHLDMVDLYGCRFVHGEQAGFAGGTVVIENAAMQRDCAFDVRITGGTLKLMTIDSGIPWKIHCDPPDPRRPDIEIQIRSVWARGVELTGPCDATIRHSELKQGLACRGISDVTIDGCDVLGGALSFRQAADESFKGIKLSKCNLYEGARVVLDRPANPDGKKEKVRLQKFYFGPKSGGPAITAKKKVAALIDDGVDKPERNVVALVGKAVKRSHSLVAYGTLRMRVPKVR